ncbi:MAG: YqhA family protein, partial [Chloroflexi bacterium]|nr:YqhA family protein [Chloroflexota bacterium]
SYLGSGSASEHSTLRSDVIASIVKAIDADLIGAILLVVALGLYELFINRLRPAEQSEVAERVLTIRTLDDLKDRISRLVLLILIVEFFGISLGLTIGSAMELLMLGVGIFLVAGAIYLAGRH